MKKYNVTWNERHSVVVEATSKKEAIDLVNQGYGSDDAATIDGNFEVEELPKK